MKFFKTEDAISFHYGAVLGLEESQAKSRVLSKNLKPLKNGVYEVTGEVNFKRGEIIGLEEKDIPKAFVPKLAAIGDEKKIAAPASSEPAPPAPAPAADQKPAKGKKKAK